MHSLNKVRACRGSRETIESCKESRVSSTALLSFPGFACFVLLQGVFWWESFFFLSFFFFPV